MLHVVYVIENYTSVFMFNDILLFSGSVAGSSLSIIRDIKVNFPGIKVYVVCLNEHYSAVFRSSQYVDEAIELSSASDSDLFVQFHDWFKAKCFADKPILYATTDFACQFITDRRGWFSSCFHLTIPSEEIVKVFNQKGTAESYAANNGLKVPLTRVLENANDLDFVCRNFIFPVIIKPVNYHTRDALNFKTRIFRDTLGFSTFFEQSDFLGSQVLCQEYIEGADDQIHYCMFYRGQDGVLYSAFGVKVLQSPPGQGIMAVGRSLYTRELHDVCFEFLNRIDYVGIGGIEFKYKCGEFYFIEMSTRPEGFFLLAAASGIPLPEISYLSASGQMEQKAFIQTDGVIYVDIFAFILARLAERKPWRGLFELSALIFNDKVVFNLFYKNDLKPFFIKLLRTFVNRFVKFSLNRHKLIV